MTVTKRFTVLLILLYPANVLAQGSSTGASHLKLPFSARSAALSEAFAAERGQISSFPLNPANVLHAERLEILLSHTEWVQDIQSEYFALAYPTDIGTFALAISSTNNGDLEVRETPGPPLATFTARSAFFQASYAWSFTNEIGVGISGKFLYDKLYVEEATGFALDAGVLYQAPVEGLTLGASIVNIGEMEAFVQEKTELPLSARIGASYTTGYEDFTFAFGSQYTSEKRSTADVVHFGAEAVYQNMFALRIGYQTGYDTRSISGGLGVIYDMFRFDYGYAPFSLGLGTAHLFTLGFSF